MASSGLSLVSLLQAEPRPACLLLGVCLEGGSGELYAVAAEEWRLRPRRAAGPSVMAWLRLLFRQISREGK